VGVGILIVEVLRSHSDTPHKVRFLWMSDLPVAETSALQHTQNPNKRQIFTPPIFEPGIPASKRPQTHILESVATGIG